MGPLELGGSVFVTILIGMAFGFVLESSGFGDSRKLVGQFYLYDMRVLKVMFTSIVVAIILIFLSDQLGVLDYSKLFVPPTFTGPVFAGGILLGFAFMIGGFCPGTSLVAGATLKLDGMLFVAGIAFGNVVFNEAEPNFLSFYETDTARGVVTVMEETGLSTGVVIFLIVISAIALFALGTQSERNFGHLEPDDSESSV